MSWNYRVVRFDDGNGGDFFMVCEVFYNKVGAPSMRNDGAVVCGDTTSELRDVHALMREAFDKPPIDGVVFGSDTASIEHRDLRRLYAHGSAVPNQGLTP